MLRTNSNVCRRHDYLFEGRTGDAGRAAESANVDEFAPELLGDVVGHLHVDAFHVQCVSDARDTVRLAPVLLAEHEVGGLQTELADCARPRSGRVDIGQAGQHGVPAVSLRKRVDAAHAVLQRQHHRPVSNGGAYGRHTRVVVVALDAVEDQVGLPRAVRALHCRGLDLERAGRVALNAQAATVDRLEVAAPER